jgi:hypothetical protein
MRCQCRWYSCNGPHGISDSCKYEAVGTFINHQGMPFELCQGCKDGTEFGEGILIPAEGEQWIPYQAERTVVN